MCHPPNMFGLKMVFRDRGYSYVDTQGKGMQLVTPDDVTISIQWGTGNYCSNRTFEGPKSVGELHLSHNAEMSMWRGDGSMLIPEGWTSDVKGWMSVFEILRIVDYMMGTPR